MAGLSDNEMAELIDLNNANLEEEELVALRYIENLAQNNGTLTNQKLLYDIKKHYTDKEIKYINHEWAWTNGWNWTFNRVFSLLQKLRIVSSTKIEGDGAGLSCSYRDKP